MTRHMARLLQRADKAMQWVRQVGAAGSLPWAVPLLGAMAFLVEGSHPSCQAMMLGVVGRALWLVGLKEGSAVRRLRDDASLVLACGCLAARLPWHPGCFAVWPVAPPHPKAARKVGKEVQPLWGGILRPSSPHAGNDLLWFLQSRDREFRLPSVGIHQCAARDSNLD